MIQLIREHPALFLGEEREDLERIHAEDENGNHVSFYFKNNQEEQEWEIIGEALITYPNNVQIQIIEQ